MEHKKSYLILGCGGIGFAIAKELRDQDKNVTVVDMDEKRIEALREQNLDAFVGDMRDPEILNKLGNSFDAALMMSSDFNANQDALKIIKKANPEMNTVVRVIDPVRKEDLEREGADMVLLPSDVIAKSAIRYLERAESARLAKELVEIIQTTEKLAIVVHDNPDPDAIASALALQKIATSVDVDSEIYYHGAIGHQENRAFVNLLDIDLIKIKDLEPEGRKIAIIDHTAPGVNDSLSNSMQVDIIIDHHPSEKAVPAKYVDIRPNIGATSTIMTRYLRELNIPVDSKLAAALLYGIRTDTNDFRRNTSSSDLTAAAFLYPIADHDILSKIESPSISTEALDILGTAIQNRKVKGSYLTSNIGLVTDRDALPQAADYLLNLEGITTVIVFGICGDHIYISGRNKDVRSNIGKIFSQAFGDIGTAGGHSASAAAQIPLGVFSDVEDRSTLMRLSNEAILKRLMNVISIESQ